MKKFHFKFDSLLRYRRHRRDLCRQLLAGLLADEGRLLERRADLERQRDEQLDEIRELQASGGIDVDRSASRRYYAGQVRLDMHLTDRDHQIVGEQLARCRQALQQADRDVKSLEKLRDRQRTQFLYEESRRERRDLDETWLAAHLAQETHR